MGAVVEIWFESLIPFLLKDSHIVQWCTMCFFLTFLLYAEKENENHFHFLPFSQDVSTRRELEGVHLGLNQWLQHLLMLR